MEAAKLHRQLSHKGQHPSASAIAKVKAHQLQIRDKTSDRLKRCWESPEYRTKQMNSRRCKPNKLEKVFQELLDRNFPGVWKYVGDGQLIIGGKCPDYLNINKKNSLIELFGSYWHTEEEIEPRTLHFNEYGYSLIVVWEHELKDNEKLLSKLRGYNK